MTENIEKVKKARSNTRVYNRVGKFFAQLRIDLEISSTEWRSMFNISNNTLNSIERGNKKLSYEYARAVQNYLGFNTRAGLAFASLVAIELNTVFMPVGVPQEKVDQILFILNKPSNNKSVAEVTKSE